MLELLCDILMVMVEGESNDNPMRIRLDYMLLSELQTGGLVRWIAV